MYSRAMTSDTTTIFVSIGNSDDKLTQVQWSQFYETVDEEIRAAVEDSVGTIFGAWTSDTTDPWQNACWAFTFGHRTPDEARDWLRGRLGLYAQNWRQDTIAWTEGTPEFIEAAPHHG